MKKACEFVLAAAIGLYRLVVVLPVAFICILMILAGDGRKAERFSIRVLLIKED